MREMIALHKPARTIDGLAIVSASAVDLQDSGRAQPYCSGLSISVWVLFAVAVVDSVLVKW